MNEIRLENIEHGRKGFREWAIFNAYVNKFYNLDYVPTNEIELATTFQNRLNERMKILNEPQTQNGTKPETLFVDDLPLGYTFAECERYLAHIGNDKQFCCIVNVKEPLYLLNFQIKLVKHSAKPLIQKHNEDLRKAEAERQRAEKAQKEFDELKKTNKSKFQSDLKSWSNKGVGLFRNGMTDSQKEIYYNQKPKAVDYQLTREDFTTAELSELAVNYSINF